MSIWDDFEKFLFASNERALKHALPILQDCEAPEGHDYYVALMRPCDHCGAAL